MIPRFYDYFCPTAGRTLRAKLTDRSASLPFTIAVHSPANRHKPPRMGRTLKWTGWNAGGCATRLTSLQTVVEQRLHLMNGDVLESISKHRLFSTMLYMRSTCNVVWVFFFFLGDIGEQEQWRFFYELSQCKIWVWKVNLHTWQVK